MMKKIKPRYSSHAVSAENSRYKKAAKIIEIVGTEVNLGDCNVLDVGIGSGHIAHYLSAVSKSVTGVNICDEREISAGYRFVEVSGPELPFPDNSFDVVISNQVIEHMTCQKDHLIEMCRVLKSDGIIYLAMPNKYSIIEPHYHIPFLSWMPRRIANMLTMTLCKKEWDVFPLDYFTARTMINDLFSLSDKTIDVIKNPVAYKLDVAKRAHFILRRVPTIFYHLLYPLLPAYIWILRPKNI